MRLTKDTLPTLAEEAGCIVNRKDGITVVARGPIGVSITKSAIRRIGIPPFLAANMKVGDAAKLLGIDVVGSKPKASNSVST